MDHLSSLAVAEPAETALLRAAVEATTGLLNIYGFAEFFEEAAACLAGLLEADGAALIVYDGPDHLRYRLFYGLSMVNQETITKFRFPTRHGTAGRVLSTAQYLFTSDYPASPDAMPDFVAAGLKSNLVFPLFGPLGPIGALAVSWLSRRIENLDPAVVPVVKMFGAMIGASLYREELERKLEETSLHDPLTGLFNRRPMMMRLEEALKRSCRYQTMLMLTVLDLDGFKTLNDMFGHAYGDRILIEAASRIRETIRATDVAARFGGDEFVIIFEDIRSIAEARKVLDRLVGALAMEAGDGALRISIRASVGASLYPLDFYGPEHLLHLADEAMYAAKRAGGGRYMLRNLN